MEQKYYTIAFTDKTQGGSFSSTNIATGAKGALSSSKTIGETVATQVGNRLMGQMVSSASSAIGFNLSPAVSLGKALLTGAGGGAIASAGIGLVTQIISTIWSAIDKKIAELRQEAAEANERDNMLVLAGSLDLSGYTIKKGKWGRDEYVYNRG